MEYLLQSLGFKARWRLVIEFRDGETKTFGFVLYPGNKLRSQMLNQEFLSLYGEDDALHTYPRSAIRQATVVRLDGKPAKHRIN